MNRITFRPEIPAPATVVVKVGSRILSEAKDIVRTGRIRNLVEDLAGLHAAGIRVILVSSGAVAHGEHRNQ